MKPIKKHPAVAKVTRYSRYWKKLKEAQNDKSKP